PAAARAGPLPRPDKPLEFPPPRQDHGRAACAFPRPRRRRNGESRMAAEIMMPQQTDTMTEGTVVKWLKKEGEKVKAGEIIAEIETDKATMEMEAFESGTV